MEKEIEVSMKINVKDEASKIEAEVEEIRRVLENHIDWVMDLESFPEINYIYSVKTKEI